jgi:hypothetical protein
MLRRKLLFPNKKRVTRLLSFQDDRDLSLPLVHIELGSKRRL